MDAKAIQEAREAENLANHRERIQWLSQPKPLYSCGTPVDVHTRHALRVQSENALRATQAAKGDRDA
ncbi:hypothetical protein [Comamonas sp. NoAH]|uniref:hypothetical protein n=1 Tax=Comamonas halotolerans TaxID=3041496 RepID=UPI0024E0A00C|nr:hypothetical protein [Comamonas sp. NoAH]